MKRLVILLFLISSVAATSQTYQSYKVYGWQIPRLKADSVFYVPNRAPNFAPERSGSIVFYNDTLWIYKAGSGWVANQGGGSGVDTTLTNTLYNFKGLTADNYFDDGIEGVNENARATRVGDVIFGLIDDNTGEAFNWFKVTDITDDHIDGAVNRKKGSEYFRRAFNGSIDARWFGLVANGVTDATASINAAITTSSLLGGGDVMLPAGTIKVNGRINLLNGVYLTGKGSGATRLDMSTATVTTAFIYAAGSLTALPAVSANISKGDLTTVFSSAPSLSTGDVYILHNPTTYSFSPQRSYYTAGEFFKVDSVRNGDTVVNTNNAYANYTAATLNAYKMNGITVGVSGMSITFKEGVDINGILLVHGTNCKFTDLKLTGNRLSHIALERCFDVSIDNVHAFDNQESVGLNYGVAVYNSQRIFISNCRLETRRHGLTFGGGGGDGSVPCRQITVNGGYVGSIQGQPALDFHGNCEDYLVKGVMLPNAINLGGDRGSIVGCQIGNNYGTSGSAITITEELGLNFTIQGNIINATKNYNSLIDVRPSSALARTGSVFTFKDNTVNSHGFANPGYPTQSTLGLYFAPAADAGTEDYSIVLDNNTWNTSVGTAGAMYAYNIHPTATKGIKKLIATNNKLFGGWGLTFVRPNITDQVIQDNTIFDANEYAIKSTQLTSPSLTNQSLIIKGNTIERSKGTGIYIYQPVQGQQSVNAYVANNISINNGKGGGTSYSAWVWGAKDLILTNNIFGDSSATPMQFATYRMDSITTFREGNNENIGHGKNTLAPILASVTIQAGIATNSNSRSVYVSGAAPTTGTWARGDIAINRSTALADPIMWVNRSTNSTPVWMPVYQYRMFTGLSLDAANNVSNDVLTGKAGSQTFYGGTATGEFMRLRSNTTNDGKIWLGDVSVYDEATDRLGIFSTSPSFRIEAASNTNGNDGLYMSNLNAGSSAANRVYLNSDAGQLVLGSHSAAHTTWPSTGLVHSSGALSLNTASAAPISLFINNSRKFTFDANGSFVMGSATSANTSAIMDLPSTTKGFLPPRMTASQRNAIGSPATGLVVYDTDSAAYFFYATTWKKLLISADIPEAVFSGDDFDGDGTSGDPITIIGREPTITAGTTSQYWRGDKSWQTLDKAAVGLSNVDNTSDANKPVSTATQTALDLKQNALTFSSGLTNTAGTVTNNLITGVSGGQTITGGTGAGEGIQYTTTTHGTKGKHTFGSNALVVNEANSRAGIGTATPDVQLHVSQSTSSTTYGGYPAIVIDNPNSAGGLALTFNRGAGSGNIKGLVTVAPTTNNFIFRNYGTLTEFQNSSATAQMVIQSTTGAVGIGTSPPNASALLDLTSTTKGLLLMRMTKAQRDAISSPADGLVIYQTDNNIGLKVRVSGAWHSINTTADP